MGKPNFIYIGPSVVGWGLRQNTIYRGQKSFNPNFQKIAEEKPALKALLISTKKLAEARRKLEKKGSLEYIAAEQMRAVAKTVPQ
jgi:hypothetical protein